MICGLEAGPPATFEDSVSVQAVEHVSAPPARLLLVHHELQLHVQDCGTSLAKEAKCALESSSSSWWCWKCEAWIVCGRDEQWATRSGPSARTVLAWSSVERESDVVQSHASAKLGDLLHLALVLNSQPRWHTERKLTVLDTRRRLSLSKLASDS